MQSSIGKILLLILFIVASTMAVAVYISLHQSDLVNNSFQRISNSQKVLYHAEKLLSSTQRFKNVVREYV
ncbi:MAG TPA: hypothetical protein VFV68_02855, partial [Agriterribacter sp.]|nr:hypothetical protein [Agriterribacter sp.]